MFGLTQYGMIMSYNACLCITPVRTCVHVCVVQENIPTLKRPIDTNDAFTPEEQHHVLKRLKTHHKNPDGTPSLQSRNHTNIKLLPLTTPHIGSSTSSRETRRLRSRSHEAFLHAISTPTITIKMKSHN